MFPARYINATAFRTWLGFPIQVVRAGMAVLITMGLVRATQLAERERQRLAAAAQKAHLEALEQRDNLRHELLFHTVRAQEEERSRIARELHDETAQVLTALSLDLATLRNNVSKSSRRPSNWLTGYSCSANKWHKGSTVSCMISARHNWMIWA